MSDQSSRRLSEISHLFLSSVREKSTQGGPKPVRKPPGTFKSDVSIDLTPEEFARVMNENEALAGTHFKPVHAVIASHLGESISERVTQYAATLCTDGGRVGVIYADASDVRISCIERNPHADMAAPEPATQILDARQLNDSLSELNYDVDQWLLVLPDPRSGESRDLLRSMSYWTLLSGSDHDSIVTSYRTLKGLCDLGKPIISIAIFGANDSMDLDRVYRKLSSVGEQFLHVPMKLKCQIKHLDDVVDHVVMHASGSHSKASLASAPQWKVLIDFILQSQHDNPEQPDITNTLKPPAPIATEQHHAPSGPIPMPIHPSNNDPAIEQLLQTPPNINAAPHDGFETIIDLPNADGAARSVVSAVIRGGNELIESPIKAPSCPEASVTVSRDRRLVLVAVCGSGLPEIRGIASAYRWLNDNRALISMAMPQFSIDTHAIARLQLLVDHADMSADILQPLLQSGNVTVKAYRKLRWGNKTGLLLEAA